MEIAKYIPDTYTHVCLSVGTGTTLIGVRNALPLHQKIFGYVPMKGGTYLKEDIDKYIDTNKQSNYTLFDDWHCGGFGKRDDGLMVFMSIFYAINKIPLDMVYTAKMMLGLQKQTAADYFPTDAKVLCIHTGGLQGNVTIKDKLFF
jgi:1-aminocyclopropane-1-carboxylate deaminase